MTIPVQLDLRPNRQLFDLTVITRDRTRLFADVAGMLAAWGMNIVRAGAYSNEAGVIVDSFHFSDVFRTIELNPSEKDRFLANVHDVVAQKISVQQLLDARRHLNHPGNLKVEVPTKLDFDSESSTHSTLSAGRRPGYSRPAAPDRPHPQLAPVQHQGGAHRHRRRNRHRRLLPHQPR